MSPKAAHRTASGAARDLPRCPLRRSAERGSRAAEGAVALPQPASALGRVSLPRVRIVVGPVAGRIALASIVLGVLAGGRVRDRRSVGARPAFGPGVPGVGGRSAARAVRRAAERQPADARLRVERAARAAGGRLRRRDRRGPRALDAGDRDLRARDPRAAAAEPAAAADRPLQLPRLRATGVAPRTEPVHARDRRRGPRPDLPVLDVAQPAQPVRTAVHRRDLSAPDRLAVGLLLDPEGRHGAREPRVSRARVEMRPQPRARSADRARAGRAQPDLRDLRGRRVPQRLLHAGPARWRRLRW